MGGGKGGERNGKEGEEKERRGGKKMLATGMGRIVQFFFFLEKPQTGTLCIFEVVHWLYTT